MILKISYDIISEKDYKISLYKFLFIYFFCFLKIIKMTVKKIAIVFKARKDGKISFNI